MLLLSLYSSHYDPTNAIFCHAEHLLSRGKKLLNPCTKQRVLYVHGMLCFWFLMPNAILSRGWKWKSGIHHTRSHYQKGTRFTWGVLQGVTFYEFWLDSIFHPSTDTWQKSFLGTENNNTWDNFCRHNLHFPLFSESIFIFHAVRFNSLSKQDIFCRKITVMPFYFGGKSTIAWSGGGGGSFMFFKAKRTPKQRCFAIRWSFRTQQEKTSSLIEKKGEEKIDRLRSATLFSLLRSMLSADNTILEET